jgi:hypothetical protein
VPRIGRLNSATQNSSATVEKFSFRPWRLLRRIVRTITLGSLVLVVVLSTKWQAQVQAQDARAPLNSARKTEEAATRPTALPQLPAGSFQPSTMLPLISVTSHGAARALIGNRAVPHHGTSIHKNVPHAHRVMHGGIESRGIADGLGSRTPRRPQTLRTENAAIQQSHAARRQRSHLAYCLFHAHRVLLASIHSKDAGERSKRPRMCLRSSPKSPFQPRPGQAVRSYLPSLQTVLKTQSSRCLSDYSAVHGTKE